MTRIGMSSLLEGHSLVELEEAGSNRHSSSSQDADDWIWRWSRQRAEDSLW